MSTVDELLQEIFAGKHPNLQQELAGWVRESRRYKAFATQYHDKIRAKLRHAQGDAGIQDVRAELATAALLLRDEHLALQYEAYAAAKQRGPDFTVTFKGHTPFNVEVRHVRSTEWNNDEAARQAKVIAILCDKVGQMPPSIVNLLWLAVEHAISEADIAQATATLLQKAASKDEAFFTRQRFDSAADFLRQYRHLSGVVLRHEGTSVVVTNAQARHKVPPEIIRMIVAL